jgi:hypothetical protein
VSDIRRTPVTAALMFGGAGLAFFGLLMTLVWGARGWAIVAVGFAIEVGGAWHHDWMHRRRGEQPHAMWGRGDRLRPKWMGGPRP